MEKARQGGIALIAAYILFIGTDLVVKLFWFQQFGFKESKLTSTILSCILFYFAYQGSRIARWLTVLLGLAGIVLGFVWGTHEYAMGIVILATTSLSMILLILPAVTVFQNVESGRTPSE